MSIKNNAPTKELGFGKYIATEGRLMRANGTFNIERKGTSVTKNLYFDLIVMSPWRFFLTIFVTYLAINIFFATIYTLVGAQLSSVEGQQVMGIWIESFFFSTQTLTTVGYGRVAPVGILTNSIASFESFIGLLGFALVSGLLYGRFSRPRATVNFSENLLVSPFQNGKALMFRIVNTSKSELINPEVQVMFAFNDIDDTGAIVRAFRSLPLQLSQVMFFVYSWTIVHPLDENSPLQDWSEKDMEERKPEFMVLVRATEEANQQIVYARCSYAHEDIVFNARFKPNIGKNEDGIPVVQVDLLNEYELLG
jgi:inward rectifier potassium channel